MSASASPRIVGGRLEELVLQALSDARSRGPGTWPKCLVCQGSMRVDEVEQGVLELTCDSCGSTLSEAVEPEVGLRLVS